MASFLLYIGCETTPFTTAKNRRYKEMEEKRNRTPLDLESTEYDVADAGKLDYRLEAGKKRRDLFPCTGHYLHDFSHDLDV